jgi:uncharacterized protein YyaL (SSP411 family)
MARAPTGFGHALCALDLYLSEAREVAVIGDKSDRRTVDLAGPVWQAFRPDVVFAAGRHDRADTAEVPLLAGRGLVEDRPAAYVCRRFVCRRPVTGPDELAAELYSQPA